MADVSYEVHLLLLYMKISGVYNYMKVSNIDINKKSLLIAFDYWEIESMGYDVIQKKDISGNFYKNIIEVLDNILLLYFSKEYQYGVKHMIDDNKGVFYYEIKPYEERIEELVVEEMQKHGRRWIFLEDDLMSI